MSQAKIQPQEVREMPLSLLAPDPMNIRDAPKIDDEFRDSIAKGVIQPIVVRPVSCVEDKKAEKLISDGKQYVVSAGVRRYEAALQAGLESIPCIVRVMSDLEAMCLSIAENKHRKDIPPWRWSEILFDLYKRLEGPKKKRVERIVELTGVSYSSVEEYLAIYELPDDFKVRLKEPEERSDFEKEALSARSVPISEEKAPFELPIKAHIEPPKVPEQVMVKLIRDEHFKKLIKNDPAKAHELATIATLKGQKRIGEVLRLAKEWKPRVKHERTAVKGVDYLDLELVIKYRLIDKSIVMGLEEYRARHNLPDLKAAAEDILFTWIKEQTHIDYVSLPVAIRGIITNFLDKRGYSKIEEVKK